MVVSCNVIYSDNKGNNLSILLGNSRRNYSAFNYEIHTLSCYAVTTKNRLEPHTVTGKQIRYVLETSKLQKKYFISKM